MNNTTATLHACKKSEKNINKYHSAHSQLCFTLCGGAKDASHRSFLNIRCPKIMDKAPLSADRREKLKDVTLFAK
jgi:hypothetical protein